ncbi:GNAT family N-acetyltransferase [Actinospica robiniae]|uniref:GNAT family N-acetyltransferase n=1 Tax=Actinospica robiniae TaxID=304901 RepID=UPI0003F952EB|nr:GNAT family N-acetyltransferase [Actinospica robiniae]
MHGIETVTRFDSYRQLPAEVLDDALLRLETDPGILHGAWTTPGGYAFASIDSYGGDPCWLNVVADPAVALALVEAAMADLGDACFGITVPRGVDVSRWVVADPGHGSWDLMRCDEPPAAQPGEDRVRVLTDLAAVQAFLDRVNPSHSVRADHAEVERWMGVADEASGELLALGAFTRRVSGVAYLASIATDAQARGQGLGAAVTAVLTRHAFASGDVLCTLAHYHPNEPARRLYLRLGYRTTHQNLSNPLPRPAAPADGTPA